MACLPSGSQLYTLIRNRTGQATTRLLDVVRPTENERVRRRSKKNRRPKNTERYEKFEFFFFNFLN